MSGATTDSTITLNGGLLDMGGFAIGSSASQITMTTATSQNSTLRNLLQYNGGSTPISKTGSAGTVLFLSGSNGWTGGTTITSGTVDLGSANALPTSGTVTMNGGSLRWNSNGLANAIDPSNRTQLVDGLAATFDTNGNGVTFANALLNGPLGTSSLVKQGAGKLTLAANNTYAGATTVSTGTLVVGNGSTAGSIGMTSGVTVAANAVLSFNRTDSYGGNFTPAIGGSGGLLLQGGNLALAATNGYSGATTISGGTLTVGNGSSGGSIGSTSGVSVASGATLAFNRTDSYGGNFVPAISGAGGLLLQGGGLTLSSANTYGGPTTITSGTLLTGIANAISGSSAITIGSVASKGYLEIDHDLSISSLTFTGLGGEIPTTSTGTTTFSASSGTATVTASSGTSVFHSNATLGTNLLVDVVSGADFTFHNNLTGSSGSSITKAGGGTLTIAGDNDYLFGDFSITGGRVNVGSGMNQLGAGMTTLTGGATLDLAGHSFTNTINVISGTLLNQAINTATTTITGTTTIGGTTAGVYNVNGGGVATFASTLGGGTSTIDVNVNAGGQAIFNAAVQSLADVAVYTGGTATFGAAVSAPLYTHSSSTVLFDSTGTQTVSGELDGPGSLVKQGAGVLLLTATNTSFNGLVTVTAGTLQAGNAQALGTGPLALNAGGLDLNGQSLTIGALSGSAGATVFTSGGPASLVTGVTGASTFAGVISGAVGLTKTGAGSLTLTAAQTYTGDTIIKGGTLALGSGGSFANSARIVVGDSGSSGAVLDLTQSGSLTIGPAQVLQGKGTIAMDQITAVLVQGVFSPGNSPNLFTYSGGGTVTLSGTTLMEIWGTTRGANPGYDAVDVINGTTLNLGGALVIDFSQNYATDTSFLLFDTATTGTLASGFTGVTITGSNTDYTGLTFAQSGNVWTTGATSGGQALRVTQTDSQVTLVVIAVAVPEPGTLALAGIGLAAAGWTLRRRGRRKA